MTIIVTQNIADIYIGDFLPYILPKAKGCPSAIANQATRLAIIELCEKALIWREYQPAITSIDLQTAYAYTPADGQQVLKLLGVTVGGSTVDVIDPFAGKLRDDAGSVQSYAYGTFAGFELRPAQVADLPIVTYSVVAPSLTAATVPVSMSRYAEGIANGALSRLLLHKDKEYSDPTGAIAAKMAWDDTINSAKSQAQAGFARTVPRTSTVRF